VVGGDLAAVGEAGFQARPVTPVDDLHFMAVPAEIPGSGDADDSGA
jgi:hypothetical protein